MNYSEKEYNFFSKLNFILRMDQNFSLYLCNSNEDSYDQKIKNKILNEYQTIQWLVFPADDNHLHPFIENNLQTNSKILIVEGLKDNKNLTRVLVNMNLLRNAFHRFNLPIILWVNDKVLVQMIRLSPDFESWCTRI